MQYVTIGRNQANQRLDKFLRRLMPEAGTGFLYRMLRKKNITLNGKRAEGSEILAAGDRVTFFFSQETFDKMTGEKADSNPEAETAAYVQAYRGLSGSGISVLYEDSDILIAGKPAGVLTQKAKASDFSLNEWLIGYLLEKKALSREELRAFKPSVCNRLDRNTSGIVLCGKSLAGSRYLSCGIRERSIRKFYRTICAGKIRQENTLRGYLTKDSAGNRVTVGAEGQDYVETVYRPLSVSGGYTLLEVELITGRSHQIRAHLASIGHPLIGDYKYGDRQNNRFLKERYGLQYQLLHAYRAEFPNRASGGPAVSGRVICAPYPDEFLNIAEALNLQIRK